MNKKTFYTDLIKFENINGKLDKLSLLDKEKLHLITIIHTSIQTVVIDLVLSHLKEEDKTTFLKHYSKNKHQLIWNFLYTKIENPKGEILKSINVQLDKFEKDIDRLLKNI